ncbi:EAL domain-containing protein [Sulfurimonas sp. HSL1-6]|uniref:EAL domain-containing protein n=1 Tax=Thiomicrolovo immobilis TaxID=3131935 RepID=UPI0031F912B8
MPIRTLQDKHYKGISELYRKSDGRVTGYYVTYRDEEGKPVKRRVTADDKDEALRKLVDIKDEVDRLKQEKAMSALPLTSEHPGAKHNATAAWAVDVTHEVHSMHDCQKRISAYEGNAVVMLIDIVAFDDIRILYGYENAERMVAELETQVRATLGRFEEDAHFRALGSAPFDFDLYHLYADRLCLFVKNDFSHRLLDFIAEKLHACVSEYAFHVVGGNNIHINVSIGASKADGAVSLMYAEKGLQEAKRLHNSYIFYDSGSAERNTHFSNKTYELLQENIEHKRVTPYLQGIFRNGELTKPEKFESLMRLVDRQGRVLSPAAFLEKSKEYRLYTELMLQMIDKVFDVLAHYDIAVTLNLSYVDINNVLLRERLLERLAKEKRGNRLTVEILESDQIRDLEIVNEFIFRLKKRGVLIAIDDFGSGFSNYDNLLNLEIDYVKLDGSLISNIHDRKHRIILGNMVNICHELGIETVAEYISDIGVLRMAQSIGVDYFQGYHLHKPQQWDEALQSFGYREAAYAS